LIAKKISEPHIQPSSSRNGFAVVAGGAARLRGVSKDGRLRLLPSFEARREGRRAPLAITAKPLREDDSSVGLAISKIDGIIPAMN
jgi:hypothetical protein